MRSWGTGGEDGLQYKKMEDRMRRWRMEMQDEKMECQDEKLN
jgi:hypothetical protein